MKTTIFLIALLCIGCGSIVSPTRSDTTATGSGEYTELSGMGSNSEQYSTISDYATDQNGVYLIPTESAQSCSISLPSRVYWFGADQWVGVELKPSGSNTIITDTKNVLRPHYLIKFN